MRVVIVGGGWSGCAASISASKQAAEVILVERTDMLLGTGLVGGIMRNNGRVTSAEEMIAMSGGELFQLTDQNGLHRLIDFPGHHHASLYNVATMEPRVKKFLLEKGIQIHLTTRISLLMRLDGIQPTGFSTLILDQGNLLGILGAAAECNTLLPIHVIESGAFVNLGAVISPLSNARAGTSILRVRLTYDNGEETLVEVKQGAIEIIPLVVGRTGNLRLEPVGRTDAGIGYGRAYRVDGVQGSALGVVIDARGRPLRLSPDAARRREMLKKWLWTVGG